MHTHQVYFLAMNTSQTLHVSDREHGHSKFQASHVMDGKSMCVHVCACTVYVCLRALCEQASPRFVHAASTCSAPPFSRITRAVFGACCARLAPLRHT